MNGKTFPDSFFRQQVNKNTNFKYDAEQIEVDCLREYAPIDVAKALNWKPTDIAQIANSLHEQTLEQVKAALKKSGTYKDTGEPLSWDDYLPIVSNEHVPTRQYFIKNQRRFSIAQLIDLLEKIETELNLD